MKYLTISLICLLTFGCKHHLPIAKLEFIKIEKNQEYENSYYIHFSSDIELMERLSEKYVSPKLNCFTDKPKKVDKNDFIEKNNFRLNSIGKFKELSNSNNKFIYIAEVSFMEYEVEDEYHKLITPEAVPRLKNLINKTNCISCVVTAVTYMNITKRYISDTMCCPKDDFF